MDVNTWMKQASAERKSEVAAKANTTVPYLYQLAGGHRMPGIKTAKRLHSASDGEMTLECLRPDVWGIEAA